MGVQVGENWFIRVERDFIPRTFPRIVLKKFIFLKRQSSFSIRKNTATNKISMLGADITRRFITRKRFGKWFQHRANISSNADFAFKFGSQAILENIWSVSQISIGVENRLELWIEQMHWLIILRVGSDFRHVTCQNRNVLANQINFVVNELCAGFSQFADIFFDLILHNVFSKIRASFADLVAEFADFVAHQIHCVESQTT